MNLNGRNSSFKDDDIVLPKFDLKLESKDRIAPDGVKEILLIAQLRHSFL